MSRPNISSHVNSVISTLNNDKAEKILRRKTALNDKHKKKSVINPEAKSKLIRHEPSEMDNPLPALSTLSVEEINKRYEEWMKIAADNKINSTNTWKFALIDYFHELNLFRDGDSINFQKASCTLDGCMKIYSSRVDSVASETGRLLNGLVENNIKDMDNIDEETEPGEKPKRKANRSEQTLAKDFTSLTVKQFDLEFSVDPLFKKTSADFDEGGARGLLFNHLSIQGDGRMIFDAGDAAVTEDGSVPVEPIITQSVDREFHNLDDLTLSIFQEDPTPQIICPSLKDFHLGQENTLDLSYLKNNHLEDDDDYEGDIKFENDSFFQAPEEFDNGFDLPMELFDEPNIVKNEEMNDTEMNLNGEMQEDNDGPNLYPVQSALSNSDNIYSYFDQNMNKGWAGPEHWKVKGNRAKSTKSDSDESSTKTKTKSKTKVDEFIDFFDFDEMDLESIFAPSNTSTSIAKLHDSDTSNYLLPDDLHFTSKTFMNLFIKPKFVLRPINNNNEIDNYDVNRYQVVPEDFMDLQMNESNSPPGSPNGFDQIGDIDMDMDIENGFDRDGDQAIGLYSDDEAPATQFDDIQHSHLNLGDQLIPELRKVQTVNINFMKTNKRVDVKKLKSNLWKELEDLEPTPPPGTILNHFQDSEVQKKSFTTVIHSLKSHYPKKQFQDLSVPFCFISLLHLANEQGLKIEGNSDLNELAISKE